MTFTVAVVTAGLGEPSSTRLLADRLSGSVVEGLRAAGHDALLEVVELRPLARDIADHLLTGFPGQRLEAAVSAVTRADALIAVTPVFTASYSGLFKSFFDLLDQEALAGKPTLAAATAGTARHSLVLEHALRPLLTYLRAVVVPTAVFAATEDFGSTSAGELSARVDRAAGELVALLVRTAPTPHDIGSGGGDGSGGDIGSAGSAGASGNAGVGGFDEEVTPFEEYLRGL